MPPRSACIVVAVGFLISAAQIQTRNGNPEVIEARGANFELILEETGEVVLDDRHVAEYQLESHRILLTEEGVERWEAFVAHDYQFDPPIPKLSGSLAYKWFAFTIEGEEIYRGQFRSMVMSSIGKGVQIFDALHALYGGISIAFQPGYVLSDAVGHAVLDTTAVDPRNDERVIEYFRSREQLK